MEEELLAKLADTLTGELFSAGIGWLKEKALDTKIVQRLRERFDIGEENEIGQHIFKAAIRKALCGIENVNKIDAKFLSHEKNRDVFLTWLNTHESNYTDESFDWYPFAKTEDEKAILKLFVERLAVTIQEEKKLSSHPLVVTVYNLQLVIIEYLKRSEQDHDQFAKEQRKQSEMLSALYSLQTANIEKQLDLLPPNELAILLAKLAPEKIKQVKESLSQFSVPTALEPTLLERVVASFIPLDASAYELAMKAIGEGRFEDAKRLLDEDIPKREQRIREMETAFTEILTNEKRELAKSYTAEAQVAYYEIKYGEAVKWQKKACDVEPDNWENWNFLTILLFNDGKFDEAVVAGRRTLPLVENESNQAGIGTTLNNLALSIERCGRYDEAEPLYRQALAITRAALGENHPSTATSLNNLAGLLRSQGKYDEAEPLFRQALAITRAALGENHPSTAMHLNNLAELLRSQGKYDEAEPLYRQALAITRAALGENHPSTATSLNNLALLFDSQGKYDEAEPLYRQALAITRAALGENHPSTATSLNNLAGIFDSQGKYDEAEPLYRQALAITRAALGENHPSTATSLNNLAGIFDSQGKYDEAEPLYRQALAITRAALGENHPDTATRLNNLAGLLRSQGKYDEAEPLYRQALAITRAALGENHPSTATSLNNLALLFDSQGKYDEAEPLYRQALAITRAALGENHPSTATHLNNLAGIFDSQGKYDEAEPLYRQALAITRAALGENHPSTATSLNNLAELLRSQGKYDEAEPLYRQALAITRAALGENHPDTAVRFNNLALLFYNTNRLAEAEQRFRECIAIFEINRIDHPNFASVLESYAVLLHEMGRHEGGVPYWQRAQEMKARIQAKNPKSFGENGER